MNMNNMQNNQDQSNNDIQPVQHNDPNTAIIKDSISEIQWYQDQNMRNSNPSTYIVTISTWNGKVKLYQLQHNLNNVTMSTYQNQNYNNQCQLQFVKEASFNEPVLTHCWDQQYVYSGLANGDVQVSTMLSQQQQNNKIGQHDGPVSQIQYYSTENMVVSAGYDGNLIIWKNAQKFASVNVEQPILKFGIMKSQRGGALFVLAGHHGFLASTMEKLFKDPKTSKFQVMQIISGTNSGNNLRSTICSMDLTQSSLSSNQILVGTDDGRGCILSVKEGYSGNIDFENKMVFKTNNTKVTTPQGEQTITYQTNAVQLHPSKSDVLITAGGNGQIVSFNYVKKQKLKCDYEFNGRGVTAMKFSPCAKFLAYGLGYDWGQGVHNLGNQQQPGFYIHIMTPQDLEQK